MVLTLALTMVAASASYAAVAFTSAITPNTMAVNSRNGLAAAIDLTAVAPTTIPAPFAPINETLIVSYNNMQISGLSTICIKSIIGGVSYGFGTAAVCTAAPYNVAIANVFPGGGLGFTGYGAANTAMQPGVMTVTIYPTYILVSWLSNQTYNTVGDGLEIHGIRLNIIPATLGTNLGVYNANLASTMGLVSVTNPVAPVVNAQDPMNIALPGGVVTFSTGAIPLAGKTTTNVVAYEGNFMPNAFATNGNMAPTQILFTIAGIPDGITMTAPAIATPAAVPPAGAYAGFSYIGVSGNSQHFGILGTMPPTIAAYSQTGTTATITVNINDSDPILFEYIPVTIGFIATKSLLVDSTATITATMAPDYAFAAGIQSLTLAGIGYPFSLTAPYCFYQVNEATITILKVVQLTTELLSTFNLSSADFETGIAIHNSSGYQVGGPTAQTAEIQVNLYSQNTKNLIASFTTSGTIKPGNGLDENGKLPAMGTWTVSLSDLLAAAKQSSPIDVPFVGAIRFVCNFTNGHGVNYIADRAYKVQAQGYPMLVLQPASLRPTGSVALPLPETLGN